MTRHLFTIDVEEYFQVSALESVVERAAWDRYPSRVQESTRRLLAMLAASGNHATCFVLGWVAERHPDLVRAIVDAGHEVASHGQDHKRVTYQTPEEFRASVRRSKAVLEDIVGQPVRGFRAPSFSIVPGREWALDILVEEGYTYDSSLFPIRRRGYGYPGTKRGIHELTTAAGPLLEIPPATIQVGGLTLPAAGGGYFRHFPYEVVRRGLIDADRRGEPGTFYIHPWEIDPDQPRLAVSRLTRARHYGGLKRTGARLERLMREFRFTSIANVIPDTGRPNCQLQPAP